MELPNVGLVGAGRIARILLNGWARAGALPGRVVACDINSAACEALRSVCAHLEASTEASLACRQEVVFLAVHPPVIKDVAPVLKQHLAPESTLVSLAPKLTLAKLTEMLGGFARIARVIPNAPSLVGRGFNPVAFGPGLPGDARRDLEHLLAPLGDCPEVPEEHLEAYAILAAMGPTYFWPQLYALRALGEEFGLSPQESVRALDKMLWGAVATIRESGLSQEEVMDLIPVKPMQEEADALVAAYRAKLTALREKLRP